MKITFLGGGNMASALAGGLVKRGHAAGQITMIELVAAARRRLSSELGVVCFEKINDQALECDVLVLAVKPQQMAAAVAPLAGRLTSQLVVSIAAGIRMPDLQRWLGGYPKLVRAMPNTPALIGQGITGLYAGPAVGEGGRRAAEVILAAVGETLWIDDEARMDAVTAISGSGPAYVFYFIEALQEAALALGFSAEQARALALTTFSGAAQLAAGSAEEVSALRAKVTSKGGTTEAALARLESAGIKAAVLQAVQAADGRGRELGELLGKG